MKLIYLLILSCCLLACSTTQQSQIQGAWFYSEKGVDYEDIQDCIFHTDGSLKCNISEVGSSGQFSDAHEYQTIGKWLLESDTLKLVHAPTYAPELLTEMQYSVIELSEKLMVLRNQDGTTEEWQKSNGL